MLKATLLSTLCGLLAAKLPLLTGAVGVALLSVAEVVLIAVSHGHSPFHYGGALVGLYTVGEVSLIAAVAWLAPSGR